MVVVWVLVVGLCCILFEYTILFLFVCGGVVAVVLVVVVWLLLVCGWRLWCGCCFIYINKQKKVNLSNHFKIIT